MDDAGDTMAEGCNDSQPLSKRQRKKLERLEAKKLMKEEHHAKMHYSMLDSARRLRSLLQGSSTAVSDAELYVNLPRESECELFDGIGKAAIGSSDLFNGPANSWQNSGGSLAELADSPQSRACRVVDRFLWRPHKYNEKYASQELSLLYQLHRLGGATAADVVLDIGGGNANLSCLIALVLDVPVICVEMESPRVELRGEAWLPEELKRRRAVTRVESLIQDYEFPAEYHNVSTCPAIARALCCLGRCGGACACAA
jgi:hypothetical protein